MGLMQQPAGLAKQTPPHLLPYPAPLQAQLVSQELIRMAILWHEMWHEALEEASRLYFGESNVEGMLATLLPLHEMMHKQGPTTLKEIAFVQAYGRELDEAYDWCLKYKQSRKVGTGVGCIAGAQMGVQQPPVPVAACG